MITQEQHHAAARRIAELNYGWTWDGTHLMHSTGALVRLSGYGTRWGAWSSFLGVHQRLCGPRGKVSAFKTPGAAIRALGFDLLT